jgi:hypothetical protein
MIKKITKLTEKKINVALVEPLESIKSEPKKDYGQCFNCGDSLNSDYVCNKCGFDKKLMYNLNIANNKIEEIVNETN